jgi:hypothetical protein
MLIGILALFSVLYAMPFANFENRGKPVEPTENFVMKNCNRARIIGNPDGMTLCDGVAHSLFVATLQRPEPKPADALTKFLVILETILAPLQAALLALAIRRKFMR